MDIHISFSTAVVKASDGAEIEVNLPPGETFESKYVQILGDSFFSHPMIFLFVLCSFIL